jgi:hypothetical protein
MKFKTGKRDTSTESKMGDKHIPTTHKNILQQRNHKDTMKSEKQEKTLIQLETQELSSY